MVSRVDDKLKICLISDDKSFCQQAVSFTNDYDQLQLSQLVLSKLDISSLSDTLHKINPKAIVIEVDDSISIQEFMLLVMISQHVVGDKIFFFSNAYLEKYEATLISKGLERTPFNFIPKSVTALKSLVVDSSDFHKTEKNKNAKQHLPLPIKGALDLKIRFKDIIYLESFGNLTYVYLDKLYMGKAKIVAHSNLGQLTEQLPFKNFYRIHKKYTINKSKVKTIINSSAAEIELCNKDKLPLSRRKIKDFRTWLTY